MSYSNTNVELSYNGNDVATNFSVNFYYIPDDNPFPDVPISVELWDFTDTAVPVQQAYVLNVDYTIDETGYPATEINTTVPVATDFRIIIFRNTAALQTTVFAEGAFPPESVEEALDKVMLKAQENEATLGRALLQPISGDTITAEDLAAVVNAAQLLSPVVNDYSTASATETPTRDQVCIIKANDIEVQLPDLVSGSKLTVKMDGERTGTTVTSAAGIDGFGTTYDLVTEYRSITFLTDGTTWYII